jgi:hypothetical protein
VVEHEVLVGGVVLPPPSRSSARHGLAAPHPPAGAKSERNKLREGEHGSFACRCQIRENGVRELSDGGFIAAAVVFFFNSLICAVTRLDGSPGCELRVYKPIHQECQSPQIKEWPRSTSIGRLYTRTLHTMPRCLWTSCSSKLLIGAGWLASSGNKIDGWIDRASAHRLRYAFASFGGESKS